MLSKRILVLLVVLLNASMLLAEGAPDAATAPKSSSEVSSETVSAAAEQGVSSAWPPGLLMQGLDAAGIGKPMTDMGIKVYGWTEAGFTGRLTGGQKNLFGQGFNARPANNVNLNQLYMVVERSYDASKQFDIGGRFDFYYGSDAYLSRAAGMLPYAGEGERTNWVDIPQAYGQMWLKTGEGSGLESTFGKFYTPFGYESFMAPSSPMYSHSYLFNSTPLTFTGVKENYIFNSQASVYFGIVEGWDVWNETNDAHSYMFGGALSGSEQIDGHARLQYYLNVVTGPEQPDDVNNYRTLFDNILTYWWTSKLSQSINVDLGTEENAPDAGRENWYAVANYFTYTWCDQLATTWRAEWFQDHDGARIGAQGNFVENTIGFVVTPWPKNDVLKNLSLRPEIRWDQSDNDEVFGGGREYQLSTGMDVVFKF